MPAAWEENFGDYANTAAMLAVWTVTDEEAIATVELGTGRAESSTGTKSLKFILSGETPGAYPYGVRIERTVTGLTPGRAYDFRLRAYNEGPDGGDIGEWVDVPYIEVFDNFSQRVIADATGEATVFLAPGIASGSPTATTYFDGIALDPVAMPDLTAFLHDPATLYVNGAPLGYTRGGLSFAPNIKWFQEDYDGMVGAVAGLDEVESWDPVIEGTLITITADQLTAVNPGSSTSTTGDVTTLTPVAGRTVIAAGSLVTDVLAVWRRGTGGYVQVRFPLAICTTYTLTGKDKSEAELKVAFHARVPAATPRICPYVLDVIDP